MANILVGEGPGIEVFRIVTHYGYFFGHYDADIEQRNISQCDTFDPMNLDWPKGAILLRIMHRIIRVRRIWGEEFQGEPESLKSKKVYLTPDVVVVSDRKKLGQFARKLRDYDGAERLLTLGNVEGVVIDPQRQIWAKLRQGERVS